jgi:DNA helicase-2/ATP-dependent DNA helicase PcrA
MPMCANMVGPPSSTTSINASIAACQRTSAQKPQLVTVRDEADQARYIVERVLENREGGALLKQQAVLFRTSSHSGPLEIELTSRNIPFVKFGGLKFLEAAHVKDMLSLLRFVENPRDRVAGFRILHLLPGVGPASAQRVLDHMAESADPIATLGGLPSPPRCGQDWKAFIQTITNLRHSEWPADIERARLWYAAISFVGSCVDWPLSRARISA